VGIYIPWKSENATNQDFFREKFHMLIWRTRILDAPWASLFVLKWFLLVMSPAWWLQGI
jgi:hypothetical protein